MNQPSSSKIGIYATLLLLFLLPIVEVGSTQALETESADLSTQPFIAEANEQQDIPLNAGWNMISSYLQPNNSALSILFAPIADDLVMVKNGAGDTYWPALGVDTIVNWDVEDGYKVYMASPATLTITGTVIDPATNPIDLAQGWSLISYYGTVTSPVGEALSSILDELVLVKNDQGDVFWPALSMNAIGALQPGEGYKIYLTNPAILTYPPIDNGSLRISQITDNRESYPGNLIPMYERFEITFQVDNTVAGNYQLPYDPNPPAGIDPARYVKHKGINVDAYFLPPGESSWTNAYAQPGFFYRDYDYQVREGIDWIYPTEDSSWKVRFAPNVAGDWQYRVRVQDASGIYESPPSSFSALASGNRGFVKVSESDRRYFGFDDGSYFPALGRQGISYFNYPTARNAQDYYTYGQNGIKLVRAWMSGFYGTAWLEWVGTRDIYDGYLPRSGSEVFRDANSGQDYLTMVVDYESDGDSGWYDACRIGRPITDEAVKPNTDYILSITYWGERISGPRYATHDNYGLVGKIGWWTNDCYEPDNITVVTSYGQNTSGWNSIQGAWNSGDNVFMPKLHVGLENVTEGKAYIREISLKEDLGNGRYGPEILTEPSLEYELYFPERSAFQLDQAVELAEEADIYLKLVLMDKNDKVWFKLDDDGTFVIGGEADNEDGFYGDWRQVNKTRWLQQAYFRYLQARWGYSTHIHSWELTNEGDPYNGNHWALADEMGKDLHCRVFGVQVGYDDSQPCNYDHPNDHMVTTSFWHSLPAEQFWSNPSYPNIDYVDFHAYVSTGWLQDPAHENDAALFHWDYAADARSNVNWYSEQNTQPTKPIIRGETGLDFISSQTENPDLKKDTAGVWLHNLTWASLSADAVIDLYWWSETIDTSPGPDGQPGLLEVYKYHANFIEDIPLTNGHYVDADAQLSDANLRATGQKDTSNNRAHLWIQNKNHTWRKVVDGDARTGLTGTVTISGLSPSETLPVEWHQFATEGNPTIVISSASTDNRGKLTLNLPTDPSFSDVAVKIGDY